MHMLLLVLRICMSIKLDMLYWIVIKQDKVKVGRKQTGGADLSLPTRFVALLMKTNILRVLAISS